MQETSTWSLFSKQEGMEWRWQLRGFHLITPLRTDGLGSALQAQCRGTTSSTDRALQLPLCTKTITL